MDDEIIVIENQEPKQENPSEIAAPRAEITKRENDLNMKEIFMEALNTEGNEEAIFLIRERLFVSQTSKNLKMMSGTAYDKFYDIGSIMKLAEKIYSENPDPKTEEELSKLILGNCVIVRNISDFVDEEILFLLFSQVGKVRKIKVFYFSLEEIYNCKYLILKINEFEKKLHRGFALIEYEYMESVEESIQLFQGMFLCDKRLYLCEFSNHTVFLNRYVITIDGFTKQNNLNAQELVDHFSIIGDILSIEITPKTPGKPPFNDQIKIIISMGTMKQCNLFKFLIDKAFYYNQRLELTLHENYHEKWIIFPQHSVSQISTFPSLNIIENHNFEEKPFQNYSKPYFGGYQDSFQKFTRNYHPRPYHNLKAGEPPFQKKIYKPIWSHKKRYDNPSFPKAHPQKWNRYYQSQNQNEFFEQNAIQRNNPDSSSLYFQERPYFRVENTERIRNEMSSEAQGMEKTGKKEMKEQEIEKRRALKEKLLKVFQNLSQAKFV